MLIKQFVDSFWPIKIYYFLRGAASGSINPFKPVFGKEIGLNSKHIAVSYGTVQILTMLNNPFIGYITDKYKNYKLVLMILLALEPCFILPLYYLPSTRDKLKLENETKLCNNSQFDTNNNLVSQVKELCPYNVNETVNIQCNFLCPEDANVDFTIPKHVFENISGIVKYTKQSGTETFEIDIILKHISTARSIRFCNSSMDIKCTINECIGKTCISNVTVSSDETDNNFNMSFQFWIFFFFNIVSTLSNFSSSFLGHAICMEKLKNKSLHYGRQRHMVALGLGTFTALFGLIFDLYSENRPNVDYIFGFYTNASLMALAILIVYLFFNETVTPKSMNITKDVLLNFKHPQVSLFAVICCFGGAYNAFLMTYLFWHLSNLKATKLNMGLCNLVMCSFEIPVFIFSGVVIKKLGYSTSLVIVFTAMIIRVISYSFIENPWYFLFVEPLHGITFSMYHLIMVSFVKTATAPGTLAVMQEIFGALHLGIGGFTGSFFGGMALNKFGAIPTFHSMAVIITLLCCIYIGIHVILRKKNLIITGKEKCLTLAMTNQDGGQPEKEAIEDFLNQDTTNHDGGQPEKEAMEDLLKK